MATGSAAWFNTHFLPPPSARGALSLCCQAQPRCLRSLLAAQINNLRGKSILGSLKRLTGLEEVPRDSRDLRTPPRASSVGVQQRAGLKAKRLLKTETSETSCRDVTDLHDLGLF